MLHKDEWKKAVAQEVGKQRPDVVAVARLLLEGIYERQGPFESIDEAVQEVLKPEHDWALTKSQ